MYRSRNSRCQIVSELKGNGIFKNYFWLHWVFIAMSGLSLVAMHRLLIAVASLTEKRGSRAQAPVVVAHGLDAPQHVGSSGTGDQTRVSCTGKQRLNPWMTREVWKWNIWEKVDMAVSPGIESSS